MSEKEENGTRIEIMEEDIPEDIESIFSGDIDDADAVEAEIEEGSDDMKLTSKKKIKELDEEIAKLKKLAEENFKLYQYSIAELDNFKKRVIQERAEQRKYGIIPFAREILHVVDNLGRALEHLENADKQSLTQGIEMTLTQLNKTFEQFGITTVAAKGEQFNPQVHEALSMMESNDHDPGSVVSVLQHGYTLNDRLIRPSKVVVNSRTEKKEADINPDNAQEEESVEQEENE